MFRHVGILIVVVAVVGCFLGVKQVEARGDLVKGSLPAVYYVAEDGSRFVFPNERIYFSWYADFSDVQTIADEDLADYPIGGNVTYRPGTRLVKLTGDPRVYAVESGGVLRWIPTESVAITLWGANWAQRVDDLPDGFFPAYSVGEALGSRYPDGAVVADAADGMNYVIWHGERWEVTDGGFAANGWQAAHVVVADLSGYARGGSVSAEDVAFADTAQLQHGEQQSTAVVASAGTGGTVVFQGEEDQFFGTFTLAFRETTTMRDPVVVLTAKNSQDSDADPGGLVRGDGEEQIEANFSSVRILDASGASLYNSNHLRTDEASDGSQTIQFSGAHTFAPGRHTIFLAANVGDQAPDGERFSAKLVLADTTFELNGQETQDATPEEIESPSVTVTEPGLELNSSGAVAPAFVLRGQGGAHEVAAFELTNALNETITVRSVKLTGFIDEGEGNEDYLPGADDDDGGVTTLASVLDSVSIKRDGTTLATATSIGSDGSVRFENLSWQFASEQTQTLIVEAVVDAAAPFGLGSDRVAFDVVSEADLEAETLAGEEVDILGSSPNGANSPDVFLTIAQGGTLVLEGSGDGDTILPMGTDDASVYNLTISADEAEDIVVDTLTLRFTDPEATRSVSLVELHFTSEGASREAVAFPQNGNVTFRDLNMVIPRDQAGNQEVNVQVLVNVASSSEGAVSGDEIGFAFEPATLEANGATSGYRFTQDDVGDRVIDQTTVGAASTVRRNKIVVSGPVEQVSGSGSRDADESVLRFTVSVVGESTGRLERLAFQIEPSDVGTVVGDVSSDNDLLEYWADVNGDAQDDNDIVELVNDASNDTVGEGSDGHVDFMVYDASTRVRDETPAGLDTARGDYGIIVYEFTTPLTVYQGGQEYELSVDTTGLADDAQTLRVTILGGDDFLWGDGTIGGDGLSGSDISQLPYRGPNLGFD